jgi:hypothetical protein
MTITNGTPMELRHGVTFRETVLVESAPGVPEDLTGFQVRALAKRRIGDPEAAFDLEPFISDPPAGLIRFELEVSAEIHPNGRYFTDLILIRPDGTTDSLLVDLPVIVRTTNSP